MDKFRRLVGLSKRTPIHDIAEDGTTDDLQTKLNNLKEEEEYMVNIITNGGKSTLSLLIQGKGAEGKGPVCKNITEETFSKFDLLVQYADEENIDIFLKALEDCNTDPEKKLRFFNSLIPYAKSINIEKMLTLLEGVDIESNLNFQLKLLEKLTSEGEKMMEKIMKTEERLDVYNFRRVVRDFNLANNILTGINNSFLMENLESDKKDAYKKKEGYNIIKKKIEDFGNFIKSNENFLKTQIASVDRRNKFFRTGGKRKQRKTKRSQNKKKRKTRRY